MSRFLTSIFGSSGESKVKTVLICGESGVGKSHFINTAVGANLLVGDGHDLGTRNVTDQGIPPLRYGDISIQLVDTPGFQNTRDTNEIPVFSDIARWLAERANQRIVGLIYLRSIHNPKVLRHEAQIIQAFKDLCGEDHLDHVVFVTNRWQPDSDEQEERREQNTITDVRKFGSAGIKRVQARRLRNKYGNWDAQEIVRLFATYTPVTLQIQHEIVDNHKSFGETKAGRRLEADIRERIEGNERNNAARRMEVAHLQKEEEQSLWAWIAGIFALMTNITAIFTLSRGRR
ncbi:unnamed protein product [Rhizoctonia solani]|uniref:G domain-containing protein n=1 Tax=Rhizoctonia solani TaxID=456999 RepID=A0A8H3D9U7_9AGAM|nr:unnamed protein product [Rhizoctonia solani]